MSGYIKKEKVIYMLKEEVERYERLASAYYELSASKQECGDEEEANTLKGVANMCKTHSMAYAEFLMKIEGL